MAAGLGFKTFTTGEVLTAADTNGYLMQGVLVFASAAARDAAITSPQEGQCCYLKDTDAVLTYSGAAWVAFDDTNAIQNTIVDAKGDLIAASAADVPARLAVGTNGQYLQADSTASTGLKWATISASIPANDYATVSAFESTTSTSYTNLATSGPAVTVTTGTKALVIVSARIVNSTNNNSLQAWMSYGVTGATTTSASDTWALAVSGIQSIAYQMKMSLASVATLTAGSNVFTAKYRATSGTSEFGDRSIFVINLA